MGLLIDGVWHDRGYDTAKHGGRFQRSESAFRNWVTADGSPGESGEGGFAAAADRYQLYVSLACPWAHRTLIVRKLKKLEEVLPVAIVDWLMAENGWTFRVRDGATGDPLYGCDYLHQLYTRAKPDYSGRVTVPVLWDRQRQTVVSNESAEIIRMLNGAFDAWGDAGLDLCPEELREEIDAVNAEVYDSVNNGVYKAGFATEQGPYEEAVTALFATLDRLEERLSGREWLVGDRLTEADIRLFTTLIRFDPVYVGHFKCNLRRLADYPALTAFAARLLALPGVADTVDFKHIKNHYYRSHKTINPSGIVPLGPDPLFGPAALS